MQAGSDRVDMGQRVILRRRIMRPTRGRAHDPETARTVFDTAGGTGRQVERASAGSVGPRSAMLFRRCGPGVIYGLIRKSCFPNFFVPTEVVSGRKSLYR